MGNFFHLQRLWKPLEDGVWSLLLPQTTTASLRITDVWWETQHFLFSGRPVQGGGRWILIQGPPNFSELWWLQPPSSLLLALQAATGSHTRALAMPGVLQSSAHPGPAHQSAWGHLGSAGVWGNCHLLTKHQPVPSPQGMQHQFA